MSWSWRMKPRSFVKTVQWFPAFARLEGQDWLRESGELSHFGDKPVHPVRRRYMYGAHGDEEGWLPEWMTFEEYMSGCRDTNEKEGDARNDKATYEFFGFGYVDGDGKVRVTPVGRKVTQGNFDQEDFLRQLLKMRLPVPVGKSGVKGKGQGISPMKLVLAAFGQFESLNRSELALLFGCDRDEDIPIALQAVASFKAEYEQLPNKNDTLRVKDLFLSVYERHYGTEHNKRDTYYDYGEALSRSLVYTGLFALSGRSIAAKVRVPRHSASKVRMLREKYEFGFPKDCPGQDEYMEWYGDASNVDLPWDNPTERIDIIGEKAELLLRLQSTDEFGQYQMELTPERIHTIVREASDSSDIGYLKSCEEEISRAIVSYNEEHFIRVASKTQEERKSILDKFQDILDNDDMSALWLEVNTWKSLIAVDGTQRVKRNFHIEDDLTPKSFAPGVGNTPDMELYFGDHIIIPEVSLMTGVRQWEHEASSVIDHVNSFIRANPEKQVTGLFLTSRIHERTLWQLFVLNRESWLGHPICVVPMTIVQYVSVMEVLYRPACGGRMEDLLELLLSLSETARELSDYHQWVSVMEGKLREWKRRKSNSSAKPLKTAL